MKGTRWVIIDTETDGLYEPIHVVEVSGQLMDGWDAVGEPFRMLLNHDVPIDPVAVAIHGYTQEYLRKHGEQPEHVYELFREYARDYPLVAHNLSFDWNRCLEPEWARLGVPRIGQRGFCCMMLARRLVTETQSYRLEVLKEFFQLTESRSHRAQNDVLTVVELFQRVYKPRLESAKLDTFDAVAAFTKQTPVAKCRDIILRGASATIAKPATLKRYVLQRGFDVQPACLQSNQYDWLRASVDGLSADGKAVVEIKCGDSVYRKTSSSGRVPDYYYGQLQHILAVTGLPSIDFWCYLPHCPEVLLAVDRDDNYSARLLEAEYRFWQNVLQRTS